MGKTIAARADFIGSRFGMLTVLGKHGLDTTQHLIARCSCDCGTEINVRWGSLSRGYTNSCGCICRKRAKGIESGTRFGRLTVLARNGSTENAQALWSCICDCGTAIDIKGAELRASSTKSCGCMGREQRSEQGKRTVRGAIAAATKPKGRAARNDLIALYKKQAEKRNYEWKLSDEGATVLFSGNCHYCDKPPLQITGKSTNNGKFTYNGIDRVDSSQGYAISNVVSCCKACNWIKGRTSLADFYASIARIAKHHPEILAQ